MQPTSTADRPLVRDVVEHLEDYEIGAGGRSSGPWDESVPFGFVWMRSAHSDSSGVEASVRVQGVQGVQVDRAAMEVNCTRTHRVDVGYFTSVMDGLQGLRHELVAKYDP